MICSHFTVIEHSHKPRRLRVASNVLGGILTWPGFARTWLTWHGLIKDPRTTGTMPHIWFAQSIEA